MKPASSPCSWPCQQKTKREKAFLGLGSPWAASRLSSQKASSPQDKERRDTGSRGYLKSPSLGADNKQRAAGGRPAFFAALAAPGLRCE